jgi:hypothetical protein
MIPPGYSAKGHVERLNKDSRMARTSASSNLSLTQLERLLDRRRKDLAKLQRQRSKIQKRLDAIDTKMESIGGPFSARGGGGGRSRARNSVSLQDAIHQILSKSGGPLAVGDIVDKVEATGYKSNSANFRGIVNQTLIKDKRFTAPSRGVYQLKK